MQHYYSLSDYENSQPFQFSDIDLPFTGYLLNNENDYTPPFDMNALDELLQEKYPLSDSLMLEV
jgi:hypothetical protein